MSLVDESENLIDEGLYKEYRQQEESVESGNWLDNIIVEHKMKKQKYEHNLVKTSESEVKLPKESGNLDFTQSFKMTKMTKLSTAEKPKAQRKTSHLSDIQQLRIAESIDGDTGESTTKNKSLLNLEVERKSYLHHIKNLRLAHKIQLKNEKFLTMTKIEEIVAEKLAAYEDSISKVFGRFVNHFKFLNNKIADQNKYIEKMFKFVNKYELNMVLDVVQEGQAPFQPPSKLPKKKVLTERSDEEFQPMEWLIRENLKYLNMTPNVCSTGVQCDIDNSKQVISDLKFQNEAKDEEICNLKSQLSLSTKEIVEKFQQRENRVREVYERKVNDLVGDKDQLIREMKHLKMIFKAPYLYQKYFSKGIDDIGDIEAFQQKLNDNKISRKMKQRKGTADAYDMDSKFMTPERDSIYHGRIHHKSKKKANHSTSYSPHTPHAVRKPMTSIGSRNLVKVSNGQLMASKFSQSQEKIPPKRLNNNIFSSKSPKTVEKGLMSYYRKKYDSIIQTSVPSSITPSAPSSKVELIKSHLKGDTSLQAKMEYCRYKQDAKKSEGRRTLSRNSRPQTGQSFHTRTNKLMRMESKISKDSGKEGSSNSRQIVLKLGDSKVQYRTKYC